jgi:hypothetical protein
MAGVNGLSDYNQLVSKDIHVSAVRLSIVLSIDLRY